MGLYACFIPVLVYVYLLFGKTESRFRKIFKSLLEARKKSLGQVLNKYNREILPQMGLTVFFDEFGFNFILGKKEYVGSFEELYPPIFGDEASLLTKDDVRTHYDVGADGEYVEVVNVANL